MERSEILENVKRIIAEQMGAQENELAEETNFIEDLSADSLDAVEIVMELEDCFDITIEEKEARSLETIAQTVEFIEKIKNG